MSFSFIHAADIHLGRSFSGLPFYGCDDKLSELCKSGIESALNNLVETAIVKNVDFVLFSGDTFDSKEHDFSSKLIFKKALKRLEDYDISVFVVCGNHDPVGSYGKTTFNYDENSKIKIIGLNTPVSGKFPVFSQKGEKICNINALSFQGDTYYGNPLQFFSRPDGDDWNYFNIALLHCDVNASGDSCYAPCSQYELENLGYDYYAVGHIHLPSQIGEKIFYPGTIQGRNPKETGSHGIRYIEVEGKNIIKNEFIPVDVLRYENIDIDLSNAQDITTCYDMIISSVSELREKSINSSLVYLIRINLTGFVNFYSQINDEFFETVAAKIPDEFFNSVYVDRIINNTKIKTDESLLFQDTGIVGQIMKTVADEKVLNETYEETTKLFSSIIDKCKLTEEEKEMFKKRAILGAKEACINFCSIVYGESEDK